MNDEAFPRAIAFYEQRGTLERIAGDTTLSARQWLDAARDDFDGVQALVAQARWRLAYKSGYDVLRNAAEAVVTKAGYRIRGGDGSHEAMFVVADALVREIGDVFNAANMAQARQRRHAAQYIDIDRPSEVGELETREMVLWASTALALARSYVGA